MSFSGRLPAAAAPNALTRALESLRRDGVQVVDLTVSNPTAVELTYPADLLAPLAQPRALLYQPEPFGMRAARDAVAADFARRGARIDPSHLVLTASTSEAYSWIFKLLCNPGDVVLIPRPSYPLFEHLTRLEAVRTAAYDLEYHGRWEIDFETVHAAPAETRAVLVVSPNNPTGSYISRREMDRLVAVCREREWALVVDEVFADYPLDAQAPPTDTAVDTDVLSFTLGGASKALGLPQVKLGWIAVGGAAPARRAALSALELIADTFLSVGTPVQVALPDLLERARPIRRQIQERVRMNLERARAIVAAQPACEVLRTEGGWSAVVRIPATRTEEAFVLDVLDRERVLVHPGFFFDLPHEAFVVVSLLPPGPVFEDAFARVVRHAVM